MIENLLLNITTRLAVLANDPAGIMGGRTPGTGTEPGTATNVAAEIASGIANGAPAAEPGLFGGGGMGVMLAYAAVLVVAMYFLMFRGPRRREKKMKELQAGIRAGDNVVVTGGMFGRVADVGEDCFIVEFGTNRGVRIPILKSDVLGVREPKLTPPPKVETEKE